MQTSANPAGPAAEPAAADLERAALAWLRAELEDPDITGAENFLEVGGHSLTFSKLNKHLADTFGVVLDMKTTYDLPLAEAVAAARPAEAGQGIR
jgi:hypothetical protein